MKPIFTYILWPTLTGLALASALLLSPVVMRHVPALQSLLSPEEAEPLPDSGARLSFSAPIRAAAPAVVSINYWEKLERDVLRVYPQARGNIGVFDTVDEENSSLGSGVIISPDGYIVTSYHVVFPGNTEGRGIREVDNSITITLTDGREVLGRVVSLDEKHDLVLLKVDETNLPYITLTDSSKLQVGDVVLAIGNPRNIGQSVSFGIISALLRRDDSYVIQTDAAINPGNSGGALIDQDGKLIGINSFIVSESGGSEGISFSVPATEATKLLRSYLESGPSGYLGVDSSALSLSQGKQRFGKEVQGFLVKEVTPQSPADKAGIQTGDVITGVNGTQIEITDGRDTAQAFRAIGLISNLPPGQLIEVDVFRNGEILSLPAILGVGEPQLEGELVKPEQMGRPEAAD
jgi:serine protease DegS